MGSSSTIRQLRDERLIKPSEIERISRAIADAKRNTDFYVSHGTLADIESGSIPSIYKIFSLAVCLKLPYDQLLLIFGVDPDQVVQYGEPYDRNKTDLEPFSASQDGTRFVLHFDTRRNANDTSLLAPGLEDAGMLPAPLQRRLDPSRFRYAIVGLEDDSMADLIPPGSLVEIDRQQNKVEVFPWKSLRERPIYFILHEMGYSCCWCQQEGNELTLVPHPASQQPVRRFKTPSQATLIGRVVHAWQALAPVQ